MKNITKKSSRKKSKNSELYRFLKRTMLGLRYNAHDLNFQSVCIFNFLHAVYILVNLEYRESPGGTPLYGLYRYVPSHRVGLLHSGLELSMFFRRIYFVNSINKIMNKSLS